MNSTATRAPRREERKGKKRPLVAVLLAALAFTGVGAGLTSAAWTDNVVFGAHADAATFDLEGSVDAGAWQSSAAGGNVKIVIPADKLANLLPGQTRTISLHVRNTGTTNAALSGSAVFATPAPADVAGAFAQNPTVTVNGLASTLTSAAGATPSDDFTVTVTTPSDWGATNQGKSGDIVVTIEGTATA